MNFLKVKQDLETFSSTDLDLLARHYDLKVENKNDLLWLIAIANFSKKSSQKAQMKAANIDFAEYFERVKTLGKGAFGEVLLVKLKKNYKDLPKNQPQDLPKDKQVAIKLIKATGISKTELENTEREIAILRAVSFKDDCNLHISCYYDHFETKIGNRDYYGIIMEYIPGINLQQFLKINALSNLERLEAMKTLAGTLKYLHDNNVVHRDIKPANIMITEPNHTLKYIDFGFSCFTARAHEYACKKTKIGSPRYLSIDLFILYQSKTFTFPEELFEIYQTADTWALGLVFYELLFGVLPPELADAQTMEDLVHVLVGPPLTFINDPEVNPRLIKIVKGMLRRRAENRITIDEVVDELNKI